VCHEQTQMQPPRMPRVGLRRLVPGACLRFCSSCRFLSDFVCESCGSCHACRQLCGSSCMWASVRLHVLLFVFACHACRVPCVPHLLHVMRIACRTCLDRLRFCSCPCQALECVRFMFVFTRPCERAMTANICGSNVDSIPYFESVPHRFRIRLTSPRTKARSANFSIVCTIPPPDLEHTGSRLSPRMCRASSTFERISEIPCFPVRRLLPTTPAQGKVPCPGIRGPEAGAGTRSSALRYIFVVSDHAT
jgi:hypothetical protein